MLLPGMIASPLSKGVRSLPGHYEFWSNVCRGTGKKPRQSIICHVCPCGCCLLGLCPLQCWAEWDKRLLHDRDDSSGMSAGTVYHPRASVEQWWFHHSDRQGKGWACAQPRELLPKKRKIQNKPENSSKQLLPIICMEKAFHEECG